MENITMETVLKIKGKKYTMQEFMNKYGILSELKAISVAQAMVKQGKISIVKHATEEEQEIENVLNHETITSIADMIDAEEEASRFATREAIKEESDLVSIKLSFNTSIEATSAQAWVESLGIHDSEISIKSGQISLIVRDITPNEYSKIARKYQTEKAVKKTVDIASKAVNGTTNAVNYGLTHVVAPTAKIAGEAGMNLGKGVIQTGAKVGAGLVNAGSKAITDTKVALATDPEMIKAGRELIEAKNTLMRFVRGKLDKSKKKSGIEFLD